MRHRKKPWAAGELVENPLLVTEPEKMVGRWRNLFGEKPVYVEIGCGKGGFSIETAEKSQVGYVALEREKNIIAWPLRVAREKNIQNIRFINADAEILTGIFAENEVDRIYLNFCDPWPNRKKWEKRRLTHHTFLEKYQQILSHNGEIFFKTDNLPLFEFTISEMRGCGFNLKNISFDLHKSNFADNIMTEYEKKYSALNKPIYRLEADIPLVGTASDCSGKF